MLRNILRQSLIFFTCYSLVCLPLVQAGQLSLPSGDLVAPKITQEQYIDKVAQGANHEVTVTVTDNVGVNQVTLFYRSIGTEEYKRKAMDNIVNKDDYHTTVDADQIKAPGLEYYIQAMDNAGNTLLHGYSFSPLSVKTVSGSDDTAVANSNSSTNYFEAEESSSIWSNKWLWIGLGVVAVGLAASGGGGGGGGGDAPTATLTINASDPTQ